MPVELTETAAVLDGICDVSEAEPLLSWLQSHLDSPVDVTRCRHVHTAVLQVLMAARPVLRGAEIIDDERPWLRALQQASTEQRPEQQD